MSSKRLHVQAVCVELVVIALARLVKRREPFRQCGGLGTIGGEGRRFLHVGVPVLRPNAGGFAATGRPVENNICSVTVLAKTCAEADALATAISVMGVEKGLKFLNARSDLEGIVVERLLDDKLKIHVSAGFRGLKFNP